MAVHSPQGKLTYEDFVRIPEDERRHAILDGVHVVSPALVTFHPIVLNNTFSEGAGDRLGVPGLRHAHVGMRSEKLVAFDILPRRPERGPSAGRGPRRRRPAPGRFRVGR